MHIIQQKLLKLSDSCNIGRLSFREIGKLIDEEHPQIIKHHLDQLEKKALIKWDKATNTITKTQTGVVSNSDFITIPILGAANCGEATIFANEQIEGHIKVSIRIIKNRLKVFAIRAVGWSMNNANIDGKSIDDGDFVIVDPEDRNIKNNDYVLSIIDDVANIKKMTLDHDHNQIILSSESTNFYPPIFIEASEAAKYIVNGKVIQVIKNIKG